MGLFYCSNLQMNGVTLITKPYLNFCISHYVGTANDTAYIMVVQITLK